MSRLSDRASRVTLGWQISAMAPRSPLQSLLLRLWARFFFFDQMHKDPQRAANLRLLPCVPASNGVEASTSQTGSGSPVLELSCTAQFERGDRAGKIDPSYGSPVRSASGGSNAPVWEPMNNPPGPRRQWEQLPCCEHGKCRGP